MISESAKPYLNLAKKYFKTNYTKKELIAMKEAYGSVDAALEDFIQQRILTPIAEHEKTGQLKVDIYKEIVGSIHQDIRRKQIEKLQSERNERQQDGDER